MSNEKVHKIDAAKYFIPLPEGDYDFQEHLTDYLLTDILNANKQLEKYETRIKELEREYESLEKRFNIVYDDLMYMNVYQCKKCGHYTMKDFVCHECGTDPTL